MHLLIMSGYISQECYGAHLNKLCRALFENLYSKETFLRDTNDSDSPIFLICYSYFRLTYVQVLGCVMTTDLVLWRLRCHLIEGINNA